MSGTPKRAHDEEEHPISAKRPIEEISGALSINLATNEYRSPAESNIDGRMAKIPRIDSRESDKRSSLIPYPLHPPASHLLLEHSSEPRPMKDVRDSKVETRENMVEKREMHTETKFNPQITNMEMEMEMENAGKPEDKTDGKEIKTDRQSLGDFRPDLKLEKDACTLANSLSNMKETKEAQKALKHSDSTGDGLDPWRAPRNGLQNPVESSKEISTREGRESFDAPDAVGENKIEMKGDEKIRDKERKRKDDRYRGWGERGRDRHDRHNLHLTSPASKLLLREDKALENCDRERKDIQKDKDLKDREMDLSKKISSNFNEKENLHAVSEPVDTTSVMSEKNHAISDTKKSKEIDVWKMCGRDNKDQKRDRDHYQDIESDRHDKQNKDSNEKEHEGGCTEVEGSRDQDREAFGHGIHQRKRMQRQKGTPHPSHREPRFRSRSRESEGSQEKSEASSIVYKVGECLQELLKSWKEFKKNQENAEDASHENGPVLEIRIPAEHVIATNRQVRAGQLWGTDIYSDDSDLVAVLIHTGYCRPTAIPPPSAIQELRATIRVLPPQACYTSTLRNNVRSRAWSAGISCSFRIDKCCIVKKSGGTIDLEPHLNHISAVEPTLAPLSVERTMTTRSAASNALRQQRLTREVTIQYNLCHEPWMKYSITVVADKGLKKPQYTSARLKKGEVLYLETHSIRYELCFAGEKNICNNGIAPAPETVQDKSAAYTADVFRWSHCIKVFPQNIMKTIGIPSPIDQVEVLEDNLEWEDLQWSQTGVWVAGKEYPIVRIQFLSKT